MEYVELTLSRVTPPHHTTPSLFLQSVVLLHGVSYVLSWIISWVSQEVPCQAKNLEFSPIFVYVLFQKLPVYLVSEWRKPTHPRFKTPD